MTKKIPLEGVPQCYNRNMLHKSFLAITALILFQDHAHAAKPKGEILGWVRSRELQEISGIAASRANPNVVWLHNDGRSNQVFGVRTSGETTAVVEWPNTVVDIEDIAMGPGPTPDQDYLYLGDIGDNDSRRPQVRVYRTPEPKLQQLGQPEYVSSQAEDFRFTYPEGPVDAEALLVDPQNGDIYIVSKEKNHARVFYASAAEMKLQMPIPLTEVAKLKVDNISAGDISRDGQWILLRNEKEGWLWSRDPQSGIRETFSQTPPSKVPMRQKSQAKNGEAACFHPDGTGYFTVSEGNRQPLARFALPSNH